jgi:hypothetical protein
MENTLKKHIQEIDGNAQRQYIDAKSVFTAFEEAKRNSAEVRGGMLWKTQNGTDYLIEPQPAEARKVWGHDPSKTKQSIGNSRQENSE